MTLKVLIVDDSKLARMAVIKALNALHPDWARLEAGNAEDALSLIEKTSPEIALLDYNMPGKDGLALAAEVRELHPEISVAIISANHQVEVVNRARAVNATFLPKPLTEKALSAFLDAAVAAQKGP